MDESHIFIRISECTGAIVALSLNYLIVTLLYFRRSSSYLSTFMIRVNEAFLFLAFYICMFHLFLIFLLFLLIINANIAYMPSNPIIYPLCLPNASKVSQDAICQYYSINVFVLHESHCVFKFYLINPPRAKIFSQ